MTTELEHFEREQSEREHFEKKTALLNQSAQMCLVLRHAKDEKLTSTLTVNVE